MLKKETLKKHLLEIVDNIDNGNTDYSEDELNDILDVTKRLLDNRTRLSKYQACKYLGISRATFDNYVRAGRLPRGEKTAGFKELSWDLGELKRFKNER